MGVSNMEKREAGIIVSPPQPTGGQGMHRLTSHRTDTSTVPTHAPRAVAHWPRRAASLLCAVLMALPAVTPPPALAQSRLPALGDAESDEMTLGAERRLGDQIMAEIRRDPDYLDDPWLLDYVQSLWQPLVTAARAHGDIESEVDGRFAWEPFLVRDRSVNAFALPGGYIGVHLGLIAITASRDELASVLAHELSHITQRHIARGMGIGRRQSMIAAAATVLGVIAASRSGANIDAANALIVGGQAAAVQGQLNFSRDMEREADRMGFSLLPDAGYAPEGMALMFEKLSQSSRLNDSGAFPYLRSHPLTSERIGEARARLGTAAPDAAAHVAPWLHSVAQARSRVLADARVDALRRWQALDGGNNAAQASANNAVAMPDALANVFGSAVASAQLRDWARADVALLRAQALVQRAALTPELRAQLSRALLLQQADALLSRGEPVAARDALLPLKSDGSRPLMLLRAQIDVMGPAADATFALSARSSAEALQTHVSAHPDDASAWALLAQLWGRLDQPLRAVRAEAESRRALGDLDGAIERLRAGQRRLRNGELPADVIEASVIDNRLRDLQAQQREKQAQQKAQGG
jgi:predicted Zn-dependent protease